MAAFFQSVWNFLYNDVLSSIIRTDTPLLMFLDIFVWLFVIVQVYKGVKKRRNGDKKDQNGRR
ncbi:MAG: hypothetical protein E7446_04580 [Ruminococcaceae bacterium]|nr:hypothetical protein [Oscillospiraceae bacterium]